MTPPLGLLSGNLGSSSAASAATPPVAQTNRPELARVATDLSIDASVVVAFGGSLNNALTYNAAGLLNTLVQAGTVSEPAEVPPIDSPAQSVIQQARDEAIISTLSPVPSSSGIYTASGALQGLASAELSANWAAILQSNPDLAGTVVARSLAQGITRTLIASV